MIAFRRTALPIAAGLGAYLGGSSLPHVASAERLYWTAVNGEADHAIRRSELDGSGVEDVFAGIESSLGGIQLDRAAALLYWIEISPVGSRIVRADLEGAASEPVHSTDQFLSRLALDPERERVYYTAGSLPGEPGVWRVPASGGKAELVIPGDVYDLAVNASTGDLYWVREGLPSAGHGTDIWRARSDGSEAEAIIHHDFEHHTTGITLDSQGGKIYWGTVDYRESRAQIIWRADLDGANPEPVTTANPGLDDWPVFLDIAGGDGQLYWVNGEDGVFYRVSREGGDAERLHEDAGPYGPFGLVVAPPGIAPARFRRGDADGSGSVALTDALTILGVLFLGSGELACSDAADGNDDGAVDIADATAILTFLFLGGFAIPAPGPFDCGADATAAGALGCEAYGADCGP